MQRSLSLVLVALLCLIACTLSQTSPIYADSKEFYSAQVTCDLSTGTTYTITVPFTISTVAHREPFYAAVMTTRNRIDLKYLFYYFMEMQTVTSTSFQMVHYSIVDENFTPFIYYGMSRPCLTSFRYMAVRSTFPDKYISMPLQIAAFLWAISAGDIYEIFYNVPTITTTTPLTLSPIDTVFVHSLVNFRLVSSLWTPNNSFEVKIGFRVVNSTRFALQIKPEYPIELDTYDDGSVRVFIYNRFDFQNMYIRMDYQVITFANLLVGTGSNLVRTYTALFNPITTDSILFGWNGMEFDGYANIGFEFSINPVPIGTSYSITLINRYTTSAIPRLDLMVLLPSEFKCPNNEALVDTTLTLCYTACLVGFFQSSTMVGITGIYLCNPCSAACQACVGTSTNCTSCLSSQNRVLSSNACIPMPGFYHAGTAIAVPCPYTCTTCSSSTVCTTCSALNFRYLSGTSCLPFAGYFDNGVPLAVPCHYSCAACSIVSTNCTTCNAMYFRALIGNTCPPISGYFDNGVASAVQCHYSCATCNGAGSTDCITCSLTNFRNFSGNICLPISGYFDNGVALALPCHYSCETCFMASTNCTTCGSSANRILSGNTCPVIPGYFDNGVAVGQPCHYSCETCSITAANCTSCSPLNFRISIANVCNPMDGYFENGVAMAAPCHYSCERCSGIETNCDSCSSANFRTLSGNTCLPNPGYFENGSLAAADCDPSCQQCSVIATNCTACSVGFYASSGSCLDCKLAFQFCTECTETQCQSCQSGYILALNLTCKSCSFYHANCLTCNSSACTSCDTAMKLALSADNLTCISCTTFDPLCEICTATGCSSCPAGYIFNAASNCITCGSYHTSCTSCNSTNCQACSAGFTLDATNTSCISCVSFDPVCSSCTFSSCSGCDTGYIINATSNMCITCSNYHLSCVQCNSTSCSSCATGFTLDSANLTCINCLSFGSSCQSCTFSGCSGCQTGFVLNSANFCITCSSYHPSCDSCNSTNCQSCTYGYTLDNMNSSCIACSSFDTSCEDCTFSGCSVCQTGLVLNASSNACITCLSYDLECTDCNSTNCLSCSAGYFSDATNLFCSSCTGLSAGCQTCNITNCQSCAAGFALDSVQTLCVSCTTFDSNCLTCDPTGCLGCGSGFFLSSGACQFCSSSFGQQCTNCSASGCSACTTGYIVNPTDLKCILGVLVCGDGFWITSSEACDDGNLLNGDGCDSNCQVEPDYACSSVDMLPSGASSCKYTKDLAIEIVSIQKDPSSNSISLLFNLEPPTFNQWNTTEIAKLISQIQIVDQQTGTAKNIAATDITVSFIKNTQNNQVEIVINYGANNLEGGYLNFDIDPSMTNLTAIQGLTIQNNLKIKLSSNTSPVYLFDYSQETYDFQNLVSAVSTGVGFMAFAMLLMGFFVPAGKLIMLEATAVTQIAFFSVLQFPKVPPTFIGLKNLIFSNGYNDGSLLPESVSAPKDQTIYKLMGLQSGVLSNFNIDLVLLVILPALIGAVGYFLTRKPSTPQSTNESPKLLEDKQELDKTIDTGSASETVCLKNVLFGRILCENTLFGLMGCGYLAWVSILHSFSNPGMTDYAAAGIVVLFQVSFCVMFMKSEFSVISLPHKILSLQTGFGEFSEAYSMVAPKTESTLLKKFYLIFACERLLNSLTLTLLASSVPAGALVLGTYTIMLVGMILIFKKSQAGTDISFFKPLDKNYFLRQGVNFVTIILIEGLYFGVTLIAKSSDPYETFVSNDMIVMGVPLGVVSLTALNMGFNGFLWVRQVKSQNLITKASNIFKDLSANVTKSSDCSTLNESMTKYKKQEDEFTAMLNNLRSSSPTLKPKGSPFLGMQEATDKKSSILEMLKQEKGKIDLDVLKKEKTVEYSKFIDAQWDEI